MVGRGDRISLIVSSLVGTEEDFPPSSSRSAVNSKDLSVQEPG